MQDRFQPAVTAESPRCQWCSAELPSTGLATCPTCGAKLQSEGEPQVPGVTAIDPVAVLEGSHEPRRPRNRLMAWLSGDTEEPLPPGASDALAPPEPAVRREMLRLQLEAELSERTAEVESIVSDQAVSAAEAGDAATAQADVQAVEAADAATDALVRSPEELQVGHGRAEASPAEATADAQPPSEPAPGA